MRDRVNFGAWRGGIVAAVVMAVAAVWFESSPDALLDPAKRKVLVSRLVFYAIGGALLYMVNNSKPTSGNGQPGNGLAHLISAAVGLALLSSFLASPAQAREQADGVFGDVSTEGQSLALTTITDGGDRIPTWAAQLEARWRVGRWQLAGQGKFLAEREGVEVERPETYTTIEAHALGSFRVVGPVAAAGVYGWTRPSIGVAGPTHETWAAGALIGTRDRWVFLGAGVRRAISDEVSPVAAWRIHVDGRTSLVGDLVARAEGGQLRYVVRAGAGVSLWGTR